MKIIILAAAALVATTLSATANHDEGHVDGVLGTPGEPMKLAATGFVDKNNEQGLFSVYNSPAGGIAAPTYWGEPEGSRIPDTMTFGF